MAEHERVIGRFVPVGQEVHRDWIAVIVTRLTNNGRDWQDAEPEMFQIPEFENQFEEIKWWASEEGLKMMDAIMCIEPERSGSTGDVKPEDDLFTSENPLVVLDRVERFAKKASQEGETNSSYAMPMGWVLQIADLIRQLKTNQN